MQFDRKYTAVFSRCAQKKSFFLTKKQWKLLELKINKFALTSFILKASLPKVC